MGEEFVERIVNAVAAYENVNPEELEPLQYSIPLDGIEKFAKHDDVTWTLQFERSEYTVTVSSTGSVDILE